MLPSWLAKHEGVGINMNDALARFAVIEPRLPTLVELCRTELQAVEVWLFGSRARGDHHEHSDWDILAVIADDAPPGVDTPIAAWTVRRRSGVHADLLTVRRQDFLEAQDSVTTLSYAVAREGIRLDG